VRLKPDLLRLSSTLQLVAQKAKLMHFRLLLKLQHSYLLPLPAQLRLFQPF